MITYNGNRYYFDAAVALMDDELREELRAEILACMDSGRSKQLLFDEYCRRHREKFGENFVID